MSKIVHVSKTGKCVFREGPYTAEEEAEWYGRQTPKAMHHNIQQGGSTSEPTTVDPLPGKVPPSRIDTAWGELSHVEWVLRYGTPQNPTESNLNPADQAEEWSGMPTPRLQQAWVDEKFGLDQSDSDYWAKLDQIEERLQLILDDDQPSPDHDDS